MFFDRIKALCDEKGVKISNLLSELGMSPGNLTRWKNGTVPDGNTLVKLAQYFDVSTDYLLGIDDIKRQLLDILDTPEGLTKRLVHYFSNCDEDGKLRIIQIAMNEYDRTNEERKNASASTAG
ncbi:MAG: helix-turn-helix transcriptional regulator [Ruminococcaceae bacterium]|nr:helix-turn-helix transcriptional regulator [Oscillospiraceae bacterium]